MNITIETETYNEKRYGKPWIAKVDFAESAKGNYIWGDWAGDSYNGGAGVLSIDVSVGDIVAKGQKDFRQPKNSTPDFYFVKADGTLEWLGDRGAAYKHYLKRKDTASNNVDALRAEREALLIRVAEIDALLTKQN